MRALLLAAAVLAVLPAAASAADVVIDGRGWGHGVGLSQYGAYGYTVREAQDHRFILRHYYAGTTLGKARGTRIRVRLKSSAAARVCGATRVRGAGGRRIRLSGRHVYRFTPLGAGRLTVTDVTRGHRRARMQAPARVTGGATTCLGGLAENGVRGGRYRGSLVLHRDGGRVLVVNRVGLERYLYGVVPAEMPASWAAEALKAQAVVARSYALVHRRRSSIYDVYADTRSQMYRGVAGEVPATNAAVRDTAGTVVLAGGRVAETFFFSTSGGRTAGNEEEWGGSPISYLRSVADPYDDLSPYHTWTARLSRGSVQRALSDLTRGSFRRLAVDTHTASGRAATVDVVGSRGTTTVSGATIRARLGLRSTWITQIKR